VRWDRVTVDPGSPHIRWAPYTRRIDPTESVRILVVCTGNICRSPMAAAMLAHRLAERDVDAQVGSAGLVLDGAPASEHGVDLLRGRGLDLSSHRARRMTAEMVRGADLVLGMAREHVREAVVLVPEAFPRTFALKELVRRGAEKGPRSPGEPLGAWLDRVHDGRTTAGLLGGSGDDDVADPYGRARSVYARTAEELEELLDRLVHLAWGAEGT
jgi:protein-tyrosine phosphatase